MNELALQSPLFQFVFRLLFGVALVLIGTLFALPQLWVAVNPFFARWKRSARAEQLAKHGNDSKEPWNAYDEPLKARFQAVSSERASARVVPKSLRHWIGWACLVFGVLVLADFVIYPIAVTASAVGFGAIQFVWLTKAPPLAGTPRGATLDGRRLPVPFTYRAFLFPLAELGAVALGIGAVPVTLTVIASGAIIAIVSAAYYAALNSPRLLFGGDVDVERYLDELRRAQALYALLASCFPIAFACVLYAFTKQSEALTMVALLGGQWLFMRSEKDRNESLKRCREQGSELGREHPSGVALRRAAP